MELKCLALAAFLFIAYVAADDFPFPLSEAHQAPDLIKDLDYIVVGGGAAGCALATTLSQNFTVLLLERGGSPYNNPLFMREENFMLGLLDEGTQGFVSTDGSWSRAQEIKQIGLDPVKANASYIWAENVIVSLPTLGPFQTAFHKGLVEAGVTPDLGATYEHSVGTKTGGTLFDENGQRRPSSNLIAAYANPQNLQVLLNAQAVKIHFDVSDSGAPRAMEVDFIDRNGGLHTAFLKQDSASEIILSASAIGTPHLLMLSGVGPADHLKQFNINVVLALPVGKNIADNPATRVYVPSPLPVESALVKVAGITPFGSYIESLSGVQNLQGSVIFQKVAGPKSTGEVLLSNDSLDITNNPVITFNYYNNSDDLATCIGGLNIMEKFLLSKTMTPFVSGMQAMPSGNVLGLPIRKFTSQEVINATLSAYCKVNVGTMWHYHGSCRVGQVVDSQYKVLGAERLRIVDGSVFDFCPDCATRGKQILSCIDTTDPKVWLPGPCPRRILHLLTYTGFALRNSERCDGNALVNVLAQDGQLVLVWSAGIPFETMCLIFISPYSVTGILGIWHDLFDLMPQREEVTWNALVSRLSDI
ncbi:protein HOTHEAD [Selaginella moellendorffii]|uniref:protein HOTHEAD n=1 Tax=Selaginella moellendorffii TaxID=88036 RepID=UPI000D1D0C18|nr:protein HOTHEAD [Selaginella moellendorffii]|eukprot:XP_024530422.1 protein HOTHEAD [Selaginella moellendorffii]